MSGLNVIRERHVARLVLSRPEVHNAFDAALIANITKTLAQLAKDGDVRVLVLSGEGKNFCAGADLNWMRSTVDFTKAQNERDSRRLHEMLLALYRFPKPIIAAIHGVAFGGGVGLASASDIVVAREDAQFCLSEGRLGILPAVISPFVIRKIGLGAFRAYAVSAKRFGGVEAVHIGLAQEVAAVADFEAAVLRWTDACLQVGPSAVGMIKTLSEKVAVSAIERASALTVKANARARTGEEGQEGMRAFLEKREPTWRQK